MRQIKFRVWDSERKQMYNLSENRFSFGLFEGHRAISWEDVFAEQHEELIPLQYTGLKDKNGREIYEGDVLHHHWNSGHDHMLETTSFVKWQNGAFLVDDKKRADWLLSMHTLAEWASVEVIGNIYENPELLEV